jgi:hypothetical protein
MDELARGESVTVFRVLDREGRPIGEVVQPRSAAIVGRGAGTVLLVRSVDGDRYDRKGPRPGYRVAV